MTSFQGDGRRLAARDFYVSDFAIRSANSSTDYTNPLRDALDAAYDAGGGAVIFEPRSAPYVIEGQILLPHNGAAIPKQPPLRLTSKVGATHAGQTSTIPGGAVLDLRYASTGGKIDSRGLGQFELDRLVLTDKSASPSDTPFVQTTNTTVKIHHNRFDGSPSLSGLTCKQDAIVMGGTVSAQADGSVNSPFQGYGTTVYDNCFSRIRRAVYARTFCNALIVRDNWLLHNCGSNLEGGAAFEVLGTIENSCGGDLFLGNQIEMCGYPYGFKMAYATQNQFIANSFYDPTEDLTLAYHYVASTAVGNAIMPGFGDDTYPMLAGDADAMLTTMLLDSHQGQISRFPGSLCVGGYLKTGAPSQPAAEWRLGQLRDVGGALDTGKSVEALIDGVIVKLAVLS